MIAPHGQVGLFLALALAACGAGRNADPTTTPAAASQAVASSSAAPALSVLTDSSPPAPPKAPDRQPLTSTGEACTSDMECALLFEQGGCCSCGYVAPLTVKSRDERAHESLPSKHCELVHCAKPPCRGPGIEDFRPVCINHSCGAVRR